MQRLERDEPVYDLVADAVRRAIVTRSGNRVRGYARSEKNGGILVPWESSLERLAIVRLEFDPKYAQYQSFQKCIQIPSGPSGPFDTYPDLSAWTVLKQFQLIEVKDERQASQIDVAARLYAAECYLPELSATYLVWTDSLLKREPLVTHLELLWHFRRPGERRRLLAMMRQRGLYQADAKLTLSELAVELDRPIDLIRLMANDILAVDLTRSPLGSDSATLNLADAP